MGMEEIDAIKQHRYFIGSKLSGLLIGLGPGEPISLEPLLPQAESVSIPVECLQELSASTAKQEDAPGKRIHLHHDLRHAGQAVGRLAHIRRPWLYEYPRRLEIDFHTERASWRMAFIRAVLVSEPISITIPHGRVILIMSVRFDFSPSRIGSSTNRIGLSSRRLFASLDFQLLNDQNESFSSRQYARCDFPLSFHRSTRAAQVLSSRFFASIDPSMPRHGTSVSQYSKGGV
jgi:hypothetical protein